MLIFCLAVLAIVKRGVLKSPTIIVDLSSSLFHSILFCFTYFATFVKIYFIDYTITVVPLFIYLFIYLFIFREGEGREKERETSVCGCLSDAPYWEPGLQPKYVP